MPSLDYIAVHTCKRDSLLLEVLPEFAYLWITASIQLAILLAGSQQCWHRKLYHLGISKIGWCVSLDIERPLIKTMGIPEHHIVLTQRLYESQDITVQTEYGEILASSW